MKQLLKKSIVLLMVFSTIVSYSNGVTLYANDKTKNVTTITFENVNEGSLLLIKDTNDLILYCEHIEKSGAYSKGFDLTNLPDADYYFELDKPKEILIIPFVVKDMIAHIKKDNEYSIEKPKVLIKEDHVYINKLSKEKQVWEIDVYYEGHDLAYREKLKDTQNLKRIYDFSSSEKGNYIIILRSEGRVFKNSISLNE